MALAPSWCVALQLPSRTQDSGAADDPFRSGQRGGPVLAPQEIPRKAPPPPEDAPQPLPAPTPAQLPPPLTPAAKRSVTTVVRPPQPPGNFGYNIQLTADVLTRIAGGDPETKDNGAVPGLLDLRWGGDTLAAGLWQNGRINLHLMYSFGDSPDKFGKTTLPVSALDDPNRAFNIWEFWYEHYFEYNNTWLRGGVMDYQRDFYRTPYVNELFLNRSMHIGAETGRLFARNQPAISIYPLTGFGILGKTLFSPQIYLLGAIYDGAPGPKSAQYEMPKSDGYFVAGEFGWQGNAEGALEGSKFALGTWLLFKNIDHWLGHRGDSLEYTDKFIKAPAFSGSPKRAALTYYALASLTLGERTHVFLHAAQSDPDINRYALSASGGIIVQGLVPGREKDLFGAGIAYNKQSDAFFDVYNTEIGNATFDDKTSIICPGSDPLDLAQCAIYHYELVYELTYSLRFGKWLTLQPNYQWIIQPNTNPYNGNLAIAGLRAQFNF